MLLHDVEDVRRCFRLLRSLATESSDAFIVQLVARRKFQPSLHKDAIVLQQCVVRALTDDAEQTFVTNVRAWANGADNAYDGVERDAMCFFVACDPRDHELALFELQQHLLERQRSVGGVASKLARSCDRDRTQAETRLSVKSVVDCRCECTVCEVETRLRVRSNCVDVSK